MGKKQKQAVPQLALGDLGGIVLSPDTLEEQRGAWCSPEQYTAAASSEHAFDADAFTNPRSTLKARWLCMLERGDDGFGLARRDVPGTIYINPEHCALCCGTGCVIDPFKPVSEIRTEGDALRNCDACGYIALTAEHRVWIQPPYDMVPEALAHHGHTRFVCLLRLDTSTGWFTTLWGLSEVIMVPREDRLAFVPPPGVKASSNPYPHGLFYKRAADVPVAISALCYPWPTPSYPWHTDPLGLLKNGSGDPRLRLALKALRAALATWCPHNPGGDGADGDTYQLVSEAISALMSPLRAVTAPR